MEKRILIADDAMFIRMMLRDMLTKGGYNVCGEAANGKEAVEMYKSLKPDLVMLDITMPVLDGMGALQEIRTLDPGAKIVMCSAMGQKKFVMDAIRGGATDFIVKPFQPSKIFETLRRVLG